MLLASQAVKYESAQSFLVLTISPTRKMIVSAAVSAEQLPNGKTTRAAHEEAYAIATGKTVPKRPRRPRTQGQALELVLADKLTRAHAQLHRLNRYAAVFKLKPSKRKLWG